jgi:hypothetical protein
VKSWEVTEDGKIALVLLVLCERNTRQDRCRARGRELKLANWGCVRRQTESPWHRPENVTVDSILVQSSQERADAAYYRSAASDALFAGYIGAGAGIVKGLAGLSSGGKASSGSSIGDPQIGSLY